MSKQKPTVVNDGVDFSQYNMPNAKEVDVVSSDINDTMYNYNKNDKNNKDKLQNTN
jgi:hypothetical protein